MITRSIYRENARRKGIYREATALASRGWHVMANGIPGFDAPPEIEGYVPEIYAIKGNHTYILYLVTDVGYDELKYETLRNYARGFASTHFRCWIIDSAGCRKSKIA